MLVCITGFSQVRYDNGAITDNGTIGEYTIQGNLWDHKIITYYFQNVTNDFNQAQAKETVREAFRTWQAQAHIYFIEACNASQADIVILFGALNHGDSYPFDGQNGVLAHAFYPPPNSGSLAGDVHFDEDENWTNITQVSGSQPIDLQTVALHEIGHSLGLAHSNVSSAIMYAYYGGSRRALAQDDIDGIRVIYGSSIAFISGSNTICGSSSYSIAETLPTGYSITWSASTNQVNLAPSGTSVAVLNNGYNGVLTLTATVSNGCGTLVFTKQIQAATGSGPTSTSFTPYITQAGNTTYMNSYCNKLTYTCTPSSLKGSNPDPNIISPNSYCATGYITDPTATSITWSILQTSPGTFHGSTSFTNNQFSVNINQNYPNDWIILRCTRTNGCGSATDDYKFYAAGYCYAPPGYCQTHPNDPICGVSIVNTNQLLKQDIVTIYPNPTNGSFKITLNTINSNSIKELIITTKMGIQVYSQKFSNNQKTATINLANLPIDIYNVQIFDGTNWVTQKLSLQK